MEHHFLLILLCLCVLRLDIVEASNNPPSTLRSTGAFLHSSITRRGNRNKTPASSSSLSDLQRLLFSGGSSSSSGSSSGENLTMTATAAARTTSMTQEQIERRWSDLINYCDGNWSGSIGWYDYCCVQEQQQQQQQTAPPVFALQPREDNHERNMRMSFLPPKQQPPQNDRQQVEAQWIVYHAREQGVREEVLLEKIPPETPLFLYSFADGILGRCGRSFAAVPVIEHGFWDTEEGMRRTIVLTYNMKPKSDENEDDGVDLQKICFLQLQRQKAEDFDVSSSCVEDIQVLSKEPKLSLVALRDLWQAQRATVSSIRSETVTISDGGRLDGSKDKNQQQQRWSVLLDRLFGQSSSVDDDEDDDGIVRLVAPNDVVIACPKSLKDIGSTGIIMAYQRQNTKNNNKGQVQVVEYNFSEQNMQLQNITATWIEQV